MDPVTLADYRRGVLRAGLRAALARGDAQPLLLPACLVPSYVLPTVFLAVAGKHTALRPLRYPLAAAIAAANMSQMVNQGGNGSGSGSGDAPSSSLNFASAYGKGLVFAWGTLWALVVLVWMDPWTAERVAQRRRRKSMAGETAAAIGGDTLVVDEDVTRSLRQGHEYYWQAFPASGSLWARLNWSLDLCLAWRGVGWSWCKTPIPHFAPPTRPHTGELVQLSSIPEVTSAGYRRHRTRAAFYRSRLTAIAISYLVLDLGATLMTIDPHFSVGPPPPSQPNVVYDVFTRIFSFSYAWLDRVDTWLPNAAGSPPPPAALLSIPQHVVFLSQLHPLLVSVYHNVMGLVAIIAALHMFLGFDQVVRVFFGGLLFAADGNDSSIFSSLSSSATAAQLWNYPSVFGSTSQVLENGLAGFWGSYWHQTFRAAFMAPTAWLVRHGLLPHYKQSLLPALANLAFAFGQSALLHAAGSAMSLPAHGCWHVPMAFFVLSSVGVVLQSVAQARLPAVLSAAMPAALLERLKPSSAATRRAAMLAFAAVWLHATSWLFLDDLARSGVWLFDPVPFSVVRWAAFRGGDGTGGRGLVVNPAGSSRAGHAAWRWYDDDCFHWHTGKHWWESGVAL